MKISIVIPARNEEENIRELLESIESNDYSDYEVIVVDGDSEDRTPEIARNYGADVLKGPGEGLAAAQNLGWKESDGEAVWFIDADCKLEPDSIRKAAEFFKENPGKSIAGLKVRHDPEGLVEKAISAENKANKGRGKIFDAIRSIGQRLGVLS